MTTDEFVQRAAAQPVLEDEEDVHVPGPELSALMAQGKPMLISELMAHPDQHVERRTLRHAHVLGQGLEPRMIAAWQEGHAEHQLPSDLADFLTRVNGVHLWADLATSRAYFEILPLDEWCDVEDAVWVVMFDAVCEKRPAGQLVLSYHGNGDSYLVLDTSGPEYLWYDMHDFDHPKRIGSTVAELLDFWWEETAWLDPREMSQAWNDLSGESNGTASTS